MLPFDYLFELFIPLLYQVYQHYLDNLQKYFTLTLFKGFILVISPNEF